MDSTAEQRENGSSPEQVAAQVAQLFRHAGEGPEVDALQALICRFRLQQQGQIPRGGGDGTS